MPDLDALLSPRHIAIIGASNDEKIIRGRVQHTLRAHGFDGNLYPVSRSHPVIQRAKAYPSVADLPEAVDLAMVIIPAAHVPQALEDCGERGIKAAYIISSGFAEEAGDTGAQLQQRIRDIARRYDMAICGPNAEGFFNAPAGTVATFSPAVEDTETPLLPKIDAGRPIAVVAQSGGLGFAFYHRGRPRQLRFNLLVTTGNEAALESFELVEHVVDRDLADVVLLYLEGIRDAATFRRAASKAAAAGKPIIVAKMGRSEVGRKAAASHTAALAGADDVHDAMFRRYGIVRCDAIDEMLDVASAFSFCPLPRGRRVGIMSGSGGAAVWMADTLAVHGLEVPELDPETRAKIDALIPSYGASRNPVDLTAQAIREVGYARITEIMLASPMLDAVVIVGSLANPATVERSKADLARVVTAAGKPVVFCTYTLPSPKGIELLSEAGLAVFTDMPSCAKALRALADYAVFKEGWRDAPAAAEPPPAAVQSQFAEAGRVLTETHAKALLAAYGVPRPPERMVADADEAITAAEAIGWPVALKVQSPDILHKTEAGAVALGLGDEDALRAAYVRVMAGAHAHAPDAAIEGVLVQAMAKKGREVILGITRDPDFGPLLMVGLGGIYVEVMRDVAFAPVPLDTAEAEALLGRLKGARLLEGVRGEPPADTAALVALMVALSRFAADFADEIAEVDLNPVIVHARGQGLTVVDALIVKA